MKESSIPQAWLAKAHRDLLSAKKLGSGESPIYDTALYHCQQSAEKAIKGYLVFRRIDFPRTHDLNHLVKLAIKADSQFTELFDAAELLTPMAVEYRYPDDITEPDESDFTEAFQSAQFAYNFVSEKLIFKI